MKEWLSAQELADLKLTSLVSSKSNVIARARKEGWSSRKRVGRGGGIEYELASLPAEVREELAQKLLGAPIEAVKPLSLAREQLDLRQCRDSQIAVADARLALVRWYLQREAVLGIKRSRLLEQTVAAINTGEADAQAVAWARQANAKPCSRRGILSKRSLHSYVLAFEAAQNSGEALRQLMPLVPQAQAPAERAVWLNDFLSIYQTFQNVSVTAAWEEFAAQYGQIYGDALPTLRQVRYALRQLPAYAREQGRKSGAAMRALQPFIRRNAAAMRLNECWVGDGHSFKAYVKNPAGVPFIPEVTAMIEVLTRRVVGWSISRSESVFAVGDAFRSGVERVGACTIYYSDNGHGQANKTLDTDLTGVFARLGVHHETGIAGNPQGRGVVERLWGSTLIPLSKRYASYGGADADDSSKHLHYRRLRSAMQAQIKAKTLNEMQQAAINRCPHFEDFVADVAACFEAYNARPHRSLPKNPATGGHFSPSEYWDYVAARSGWQAEIPEAQELALLFRPEVWRTVQRGEVALDNKRYFHLALADYDGQQVRVCYDVHDPATVLVKQADGRAICEAVLDGNRVDYFPASVRESAERKSLAARIRRKEDAAALLRAQSAPALEAQADFTALAAFGAVKPEKKVYAVFAEDAEFIEKQG